MRDRLNGITTAAALVAILSSSTSLSAGWGWLSFGRDSDRCEQRAGAHDTEGCVSACGQPSDRDGGDYGRPCNCCQQGNYLRECPRYTCNDIDDDDDDDHTCCLKRHRERHFKAPPDGPVVSTIPAVMIAQEAVPVRSTGLIERAVVVPEREVLIERAAPVYRERAQAPCRERAEATCRETADAPCRERADATSNAEANETLLLLELLMKQTANERARSERAEAAHDLSAESARTTQPAPAPVREDISSDAAERLRLKNEILREMIEQMRKNPEVNATP